MLISTILHNGFQQKSEEVAAVLFMIRKKITSINYEGDKGDGDGNEVEELEGGEDCDGRESCPEAVFMLCLSRRFSAVACQWCACVCVLVVCCSTSVLVHLSWRIGCGGESSLVGVVVVVVRVQQ